MWKRLATLAFGLFCFNLFGASPSFQQVTNIVDGEIVVSTNSLATTNYVNTTVLNATNSLGGGSSYTNLGNSVVASMTNAANQFTGAFTGNGGGLTNLASSGSGQPASSILTNLSGLASTNLIVFTNSPALLASNILPTSTNSFEALVINSNASAGFSYAHALPIALAPIMVTGYSRPQVSKTNITSMPTATDVDFYVIPSGKKAMVQEALFTTYGSATISFYWELKRGGVYYPLYSITGIGITSNSATAASPTGQFVFKYGDTIALKMTQSGGGGSVYLNVIQFDDTAPIKTVGLTTISNSLTQIYTVPAGIFAKIIGNQLSTLTALGLFYNGSSNSVNIAFYYTPSGGAPLEVNGITIGSGQIVGSTTYLPLTTLNPGDVISGQSSTNAANQYAWFTVVEESQ